MAEIKLTKNELRAQQSRLGQLKKYLPTLQLKKAMLQAEVVEARAEIAKCERAYQLTCKNVEKFSELLMDRTLVDPLEFAKISQVHKRYENIAGIDVPYFEGIEFKDYSYDLYDSPPWLDSAVVGLRAAAESKARILVAQEKKMAIENELRQVSIRVNLFEKILIPRALVNIRKIKVFLGDQQLAAVSQAKVAKRKIEKTRGSRSEG